MLFVSAISGNPSRRYSIAPYAEIVSFGRLDALCRISAAGQVRLCTSCGAGQKLSVHSPAALLPVSVFFCQKWWLQQKEQNIVSWLQCAISSRQNAHCRV